MVGEGDRSGGDSLEPKPDRQVSANDPQEPAQAEQKISRRVQQFEARLHIGPLPPPDILREYDKIVPGLASTVVETFRQQSEHRRFLEQKMVVDQNDLARSGQRYGFWLSLVVAVGGFALAWRGQVGGYVVLVGLMTALASVFVVGKEISLRDLLKKRGKVDEGLASQSESPSNVTHEESDE